MRELDDARYKAIGARIREVRIQKNMSQAELAEKAFISVPHMSEVENGKTKLRLSTFVYITEACLILLSNVSLWEGTLPRRTRSCTNFRY